MTQRPCLAMCLLAAIGLLAPRLVLVLIGLIIDFGLIGNGRGAVRR